MFKILTEASGSLTSAYLINSIKAAGYCAVASDIDDCCVGRYLADDFIPMLPFNHQDLWIYIKDELVKHKVNIVIPSLDETLQEWARRKDEFLELGITVVLSDVETVRIFQDKWLTYQFFCATGIPTPLTSLKQEYRLIKPRNGRGSSGIKITDSPVEMDGMISQELLQGEEYTVDVFCDANSKPIYIIPRKREKIIEGKAVNATVENHSEIIKWCEKICEQIPFCGPVNIQCFDCGDGNIKFIEINPRIAGGMALGFAASENWMKIIVESFILGKKIIPQPVKYGLKMKRYYAEVFVS